MWQGIPQPGAEKAAREVSQRLGSLLEVVASSLEGVIPMSGSGPPGACICLSETAGYAMQAVASWYMQAELLFLHYYFCE